MAAVTHLSTSPSAPDPGGQAGPVSPAPAIDPRLRRLDTINLVALVILVPQDWRWRSWGSYRADAYQELASRGIVVTTDTPALVAVDGEAR